jgi:transketolase
VITELPVDEEDIPAEFLDRLSMAPAVWVVEEHVAQGSFGRMLGAWLLEHRFAVQEFRHFCAKGYLSSRFGSQEFHRRECGIDGLSLRELCCNRRLLAHRA